MQSTLILCIFLLIKVDNLSTKTRLELASSQWHNLSYLLTRDNIQPLLFPSFEDLGPSLKVSLTRLDIAFLQGRLSLLNRLLNWLWGRRAWIMWGSSCCHGTGSYNCFWEKKCFKLRKEDSPATWTNFNTCRMWFLLWLLVISVW